MTRDEKKLAIIAGNGKLTTLLAKSASSQGFKTYGLAITEEAKHKLEGICNAVYKFAPGQVSKMINVAKNELINQVVFIGKVPKIDLLRNIHKLDWLAIKNLSKLKNLHDDSIHESIVQFLQKYDIKILPQTQFLQELFLEKQILSKRKPSLEERLDIEYGFDIAKKVGGLDIGQTVIVKNKMILAIEAIEGTDEAIKRGSRLANGEVVVVKVAKPNQDERFDIPTIGTKTIETLAQSGGGILAFENNKTIVTDIEACKKAADKHNICLLSV